MFNYPVILSENDETVMVSFPDIPEALTFGQDEEEALIHAIDALETGLSFYIEDRKPLPVASIPLVGQKTVSPSPLECAKLGIYKAMMEQGIRKTELARRLGWHLPQIDRLFDLKHASRLDQLEAAARALNRHLSITISS
jgi:antitoxin HicB